MVVLEIEYYLFFNTTLLIIIIVIVIGIVIVIIITHSCDLDGFDVINDEEKSTTTKAHPASVDGYINRIKVLYTNANQLTNKIELLRSRCKHEEPTVIGINEVKHKNNRYPVNAAEFKLEDLNYDMFKKNTGRGLLL